MELQSPPPEILERKKLAIELRTRYEIYFVTVVFTFAGLAVQTAKPTPGPIFPLLEIGAWLCLLVAGLVGLWRVGRLWRREFGVAEFYEAQLEPSNRSEQFREQLVAQDARLEFLHKIQFFFFILGLLLVGAARAVALLGYSAYPV